MLDDFMVRAGLAGVGLALASGPLGCFIVWRRMAYFGDATAHAAIMGVALALAFDASIFVGVLMASLAMASLVTRLSRQGLAVDTLLGVAAHAALAFGLVAVAMLTGGQIDLDSFLFGDILAVTRTDLAVIWGGALAACGLLAWRWRRLLAVTLNEDLAFASGVRPAREDAVLVIALAIAVAVAIKIVGALLITAMLLIPAATARAFARTPEAMAIAAVGVGVIAVGAGLSGSYYWDLPTGPAIVSAAALGFAFSRILGARKGQ